MDRDATWFSKAWIQRGVDALKATLDQSEERKGEMVQFLFDTGLWDASKLTWAAAISRFNGNLDPSKREFFKTVEIWVLMKRFGMHEFFVAMADDLGYRIERIPTEAYRNELLRRNAVALERHNELMAASVEIAKDVQTSLAEHGHEGFRPRIHPGVGAGGVFDLPALMGAEDKAPKGF